MSAYLAKGLATIFVLPMIRYHFKVVLTSRFGAVDNLEVP